jgi:SAM-dependent methyltransferase
MTEQAPARNTASDWASSRGQKWRAQLSGMEAMLAPVDEPLLGALELDAPARIADIGCGGGATALSILRRAPAGSFVHGFDVSPALIEAARERVPPQERAIAFDIANVATAPAPKEPYDRLVSRFGIMFFDDPPAAFDNLARWLAPGGRFAFAAWGRPAENPWMTSVRDVVAEFVDVPPPDPEAPGPFRHADASTLLTLLARAGFGDLDVRDVRCALPIGGELSPSDAATFALAAFSSFEELLGGARDAARRSLTALFSRHHRDGAVRMDACVHIFTGSGRFR